MMSLGTIQARNREVAERAAAEGFEPFVYFDTHDVDLTDNFPFPDLGDHRPDGWELVDTHFADATGLGQSWEPALTPEQLRALIKERIEESGQTVGWAVIEAGQFQVYVGEFHKVR